MWLKDVGVCIIVTSNCDTMAICERNASPEIINPKADIAKCFRGFFVIIMQKQAFRRSFRHTVP